MPHEYQRLKFKLVSQIRKGKWQPGDVLPSENELAARYGLARFTVRQALQELVQEGLITKHKGKGSIVAERKRKALGLFSIKGFSQVVGEDLQGTVRSRFLKDTYEYHWGDDFFYTLSDAEIKKGAFCLERLRSVDDQPVMLEFTYIPKGTIPMIHAGDLVGESLFETLHSVHHIDVLLAEQELVATGASRDIAAVFSIKPGTPVLHVYRKYQTSIAGFFIYSSLYCHTEKFSVGNVFH